MKPRYTYNATEIEADAIDGALALTFRTDGEIDLTVLLSRALADQLMAQVARLQGE